MRARLAARPTCGNLHFFPSASLMNVFANSVVTISFKLYDASNQLLEESPEPLSYLHGGHSGIFPSRRATRRCGA
jgi:hypothetical protein